MKTVALVIHYDRHADTEVTAFAQLGAALSWASKRAREFDRFGDLDETLTGPMQRAGWLYFARYGEGNYIRVQTVEVR